MRSMLPPHAASAGHALQRAGVDLGSQHGHRGAARACRATSASTSGIDGTSTPEPSRRRASAAARAVQPRPAPAPPRRRAAGGRAPAPAPRRATSTPARPARRTVARQCRDRLATHRHQVRRPASPRVGLTASATSFSADPTLPLDPTADHAGRHAGHHAAVRDHAAHDRTGGHHDVLADLRARQDDDVGPQPAARTDAHRRLGRPLPPDRLDRVLVGVVLVGDVDVGPGLDVVTDLDRPVADDVRPPADDAAAADATPPGRSASPGRAPCPP